MPRFCKFISTSVHFFSQQFFKERRKATTLLYIIISFCQFAFGSTVPSGVTSLVYLVTKLKYSTAQSVQYGTWVSAHRSIRGQLTLLGKVDENLKSENMQNVSSFLETSLKTVHENSESSRALRTGTQNLPGSHSDFRMHSFKVIFSNFFSPLTARVEDPL